MCGIFVAVFVASFAGRGDLYDDDQKIMSYNVVKKNDIICHPRHLLEEERGMIIVRRLCLIMWRRKLL